MKSYHQILLIFLLFSCSSIKEWKLDYLKGKYEKEYQICEDILNKKVNLDLIYSDPEISSEFLLKKFKNRKNIFTFLQDQFTDYHKFKLVVIDKFKVSVAFDSTYTHLDIVFEIKTDNLIEVVSFDFKLENNKFKLYDISKNESKYYMHRRPKIDKPTGHGAHYNY